MALGGIVPLMWLYRRSQSPSSPHAHALDRPPLPSKAMATRIKRCITCYHVVLDRSARHCGPWPT